MKTVLQIIAWSFGIVLGVAILLVGGITLWALIMFDPNDYKDRLVAEVEQQTGRDFQLNGELRLTFFPWLGVELNDVVLGNAPGFGATPLLRTDRVQARAKLMPLLRQDIQIDTVLIDGAEIYLAVNAQGQSNWQDLATATGAPAERQPNPPAPEDSATPLAFTLNGIDIRNTQLILDDRAAGQRFEARAIRLSTGPITPAQPIDWTLAFSFDAAPQDVTGDVSAQGTLQNDFYSQRATLDPVQLQAKLQGEMLPSGAAAINLQAGLTFDQAAGKLTLTDLKLTGLGATLTGRLQATETATTTPSIDGAFDLAVADTAALARLLAQEQLAAAVSALQAELAITGDARQLRIEPLTLTATLNAAETPAKPTVMTLSAPIVVDPVAHTLTIAALQLRGPELNASGRLQATAITTAPTFAGELTVAPFNPRRLLAQLNQPQPLTLDPTALTQAALKARFRGAPERIRLETMTIELDQTRLTGTAAVTDFAQPAIVFDLAVDTLDLDRYLPPETLAAAPPPAAPPPVKAPADEPAEVSLDTLRDMTIQGRLQAGWLQVANAELRNVTVGLDGKDGIIRLAPLRADLYQGALNGELVLNANGTEPQMTLAAALDDVRTEALLADLAGTALLTGAGSVSAKLTAFGAQPAALLQSLTGTGKFDFRDGSIQGVNIGYILRQAAAYLLDQDTAATPAVVATDFGTLSGTFDIRNGLVANDDLVLNSPVLRVSGQGAINLVAETLNYTLDAGITKALAQQGGKDIAVVGDYTIPVRVTGSFDALAVQPDLSRLAEAQVRLQIDQEKDKLAEKVEKKLKQKLGDELGEEVGNTLKKLFDF